MEVICINDKFSDESKRLIPNLPVEDSLYTFRAVIPRLDNGQVGVLLYQIENPELAYDVSNPQLGTFEPTFNINRFAKLDRTPLTKKEITEVKKNIKKSIKLHQITR